MKEKRGKARNSAGMPTYKADDYNYSVAFSEEDDAFIGRVAEFPSLAAHGATLEKALRETRALVESVIEDLEACGEILPEPFRKRSYSGRINVRMPEQLHRQLAIEAQQQRVSLNQWINAKLGRPVK
jgi:predicted HicB family RNase H-like nuclease